MRLGLFSGLGKGTQGTDGTEGARRGWGGSVSWFFEDIMAEGVDTGCPSAVCA